MKVGTDGVLIGAWADVSNAKRALDVGTGCGIISLMLAQRGPEMMIDAIDIDHDSVTEAQYNFDNSPWHDRLRAIEGDFNTVELTEKYDLIVSNPPFFTGGIVSPKESRMNARHTVSLDYNQLLARAKTLLNSSGIISIVSPCTEREVILDACRVNALYVKRITEVYPLENQPAKRILWEFVTEPAEPQVSALVIEKIPGEYTEEFRSLCSDFYLKF